MDKTKIAVNIFDKYAKEYEGKFMNVDLYKETFDLFCEKIINKNADVLELACGPGNITNYLLNKRPDFNVIGIDLSPNMIALAKINNPTAVFQLMDCREIARIEKKYDAVMCGFCLPYLSKQEVLKLMKDVATLLNEKGIFYISTMEDDYLKSGFRKGSKGDEIYMHYYQTEYLTAALQENNFEITDVQRKKYAETDGTITTDLIIIAEKNSDLETKNI